MARIADPGVTRLVGVPPVPGAQDLNVLVATVNSIIAFSEGVARDFAAALTRSSVVPMVVVAGCLVIDHRRCRGAALPVVRGYNLSVINGMLSLNSRSGELAPAAAACDDHPAWVPLTPLPLPEAPAAVELEDQAIPEQAEVQASAIAYDYAAIRQGLQLLELERLARWGRPPPTPRPPFLNDRLLIATVIVASHYPDLFVTDALYRFDPEALLIETEKGFRSCSLEFVHHEDYFVLVPDDA